MQRSTGIVYVVALAALVVGLFGGYVLKGGREVGDLPAAASVPAASVVAPRPTLAAAASARVAAAPARSLFDQVADAKLASARGDAKASRFLSETYGKCWIVAYNSNSFLQGQQDLAETAAAAGDTERAHGFMRAAQVVMQECAGFTSRDIDVLDWMRMQKLAARQGDLASQIYQALYAADDAHPISGEEANRLLRDVQASRDPAAFDALASLMASDQSQAFQDAVYPYLVNSPRVGAAWNLAACRLGKDCSANTTDWAYRCVSGGSNCRQESLEDFFRDALSPMDGRWVDREVPKLLGNGR